MFTEFTRSFFQALAWCAVLAAPVMAQPDDVAALARRRGRPIFRPEADVPMMDVRRLVFSDDGRHLFSAGYDKVVRRWELRSGGPQPDGPPSPDRMELVETIRWPLHRDQMGRIYGLDIERKTTGPDRIAFGGIGYSTSQINLVDPDSPERAQVLLHTDQPRPYEIVYAVSFHPHRPLLAVGLGGEPGKPNAQVVIWDVAERQAAAPAGRIESGLPFVHFVEYSPDGRRLAVAETSSGIVQVWDVPDDPSSEPRRLAQVNLGTQVRGLAWVDQRTWVAATTTKGLQFGGGGSAVESDAEPGGVIRLTNMTAKPVLYKVWVAEQRAYSRAGTLAPGESARPSGRHLYLVQNPQDNPASKNLDSLALPAGVPAVLEIHELQGQLRFVSASHVTAVAAHPEIGLVASGIFDPHRARYGEKPAQVVLRSRHAEQTGRFDRQAMPTLEKSGFDGPITALAFSPDGELVAAAGSDRYDSSEGAAGIEIRLWSARTGKLLAQVPGAAQSVDAGSPIASVSILEETLIGFARGSLQPTVRSEQAAVFEPAPLTMRFELSNPRSLAALDASRRLTVPNWTIEWKNSDAGYVYYLQDRERPQQKFGPFPYLPQNDVPLAAQRFQRGGREFLAVGYVSGILIWDLKAVEAGHAVPLETRAAALARALSGHEGKVTCLDVAADGDWLISGSDDGTICGWSLKGIENDPRKRRELGVEFGFGEDGQLLVRAVDRVGPGWSAGFLEGQQIVRLFVGGKLLYEAGPTGDRRQAVEALARLQHPVPGEQYSVDVRFQGNLFALNTLTLRDPLWTLYPLLDGDWALWSPEGYFDATEGGAQHMGWHINTPGRRPEDVKVRFVSADLFWERYFERAQFRWLTDYRDPERFLSRVKNKPPTSETLTIPSRIAIEQLAVTDKGLRISAQAEPSGAETVEGIQLWCNGFLVYPSPTSAARLVRENGRLRLDDVMIPYSQLRSGEGNTIVAVVESELDGRQLLNRTTKAFFRPVESRRKPKLHFIGVGITELDNASTWESLNPPIRELRYTANDAYYLAEAFGTLLAQDYSQYDRGIFQLLINPGQVPALADPGAGNGVSSKAPSIAAPTKENIIQALDELVEELGPRRDRGEASSADDLVVVLMSGHGFDDLGIEDLGIGVERRNEGFYLITQDTGADLANALTRDEIHSRLQQLPCKTLLLMDACHSGGVVSPEKLNDLGGLLIGPQILVSCRERQTSLEHRLARLANGRPIGHGVFTAALIEALRGEQLVLDGMQLRMNPLPAVVLERTHDGRLTVEELCIYAQKRVPVLRELLAKVEAPQIRTAAVAESDQDPQILSSLTFPAETTELIKLGR